MNRKQEIIALKERIGWLENFVGYRNRSYDEGIRIFNANPDCNVYYASLSEIANAAVRKMGMKYKRGTDNRIVCDDTDEGDSQ